MSISRQRIALAVGILSILLSIVPIIEILHPNFAPEKPVLFLGCLSGSLLAAVAAGFIGSRLWFLALLVPSLTMFFILAFAP